MKEGNANQILKHMLRMHDGLRGQLLKDMKGMKPFATQPLKPAEKVYYFDNLGIEDKNALIQEFGQDAYNNLMIDMAIMRDRMKGV